MSYNHYSKGAVVSFLHQYVAGLQPPRAPGAAEAGYRRFIIAPRPGAGLTWASARRISPHGLIACDWRHRGNEFTPTMEVLPGTQSEIRLPVSGPMTAGLGAHTYTVALPPPEG
ncbi:alpha-L-rhamnosidase C-terminal domain-containing protein [Streptomyces sp. CB03238]|uniref:alpha-L-rhamnosidase C-terminal domain-containing protein n=1 Tax=Streptomyces sp. CB03238 TaxID=1907777 RepID=UPI000A105EC8|nr:alpha-L-rhamnosidase C-terminal domain-containing protein [Streptomyces sp. CB03238]ORT59123.1 hypothetical protein BKD26_13970 [Streptomyces sp. CB03238]